MESVLKTPPTMESGVRKNTTGMLSCSKLFDHRPTIRPSKPKMVETLTTQKTNMGQEYIWVTPKAMPMNRMPIPVTVARSTTTLSAPKIISTYDSGETSNSSTNLMKREK